LVNFRPEYISGFTSGVIALVCEEGENTCDGGGSVIVDEFSQG